MWGKRYIYREKMISSGDAGAGTALLGEQGRAACGAALPPCRPRAACAETHPALPRRPPEGAVRFPGRRAANTPGPGPPPPARRHSPTRRRGRAPTAAPRPGDHHLSREPRRRARGGDGGAEVSRDFEGARRRTCYGRAFPGGGAGERAPPAARGEPLPGRPERRVSAWCGPPGSSGCAICSPVRNILGDRVSFRDSPAGLPCPVLRHPQCAPAAGVTPSPERSPRREKIRHHAPAVHMSESSSRLFSRISFIITTIKHTYLYYQVKS